MQNVLLSTALLHRHLARNVGLKMETDIAT